MTERASWISRSRQTTLAGIFILKPASFSTNTKRSTTNRARHFQGQPQSRVLSDTGCRAINSPKKFINTEGLEAQEAVGRFAHQPSETQGEVSFTPAEDRDGAPHDFSDSALLAGASSVDLAGEGQYDTILGTAHLGVLNSPDAWSAAFTFLDRP
jgi:hypothetical protein